MSAARALLAESLGSLMLLAVVVGSGIMGERLAAGNAAVALLANAIATGAGLWVLVTLFAPISGAHFNPVVTAIARLRGAALPAPTVAYVAAQLAGAIAGVILAHAMFDLAPWQPGVRARNGPSQWLSEGVATFGLLLTIILGARHRPRQLPALIGAYVAAAYWFTASTAFANPAVTIARALTQTFAGIRPADVPAFVLAQCAGGLLAYGVARWLLPPAAAGGGDSR